MDMHKKVEWRDLEGTKEKVKNATMKIKRKIIPWKMGKKAWHSEEWKKIKRGLRRELKRMKKGKTSREEYIKKKERI